MNKRKFLSLPALLLSAAALFPACAGYEPSKPTDWPELDSEGNWIVVEPTSEGGKTSDPWQEWDKKPCDPADYPLTITELMPKATLPLSDGQVSDWVELYNAGGKEIDLSTMYFCGKAMSGSAAPGYTVVRVSVPNGDKVELRLPDGQLADSLELPKLEKDHAWAKQPDGSFAETIFATPGGENTMSAYEKLLANETPGDLRIEEVVVANCSGWSTAGGPWIAPSNSMKVVVTSETPVTGGTRFRGRLPLAEKTNGFYADIAALAIPDVGTRQALLASGETRTLDAHEATSNTVSFALDRPFAATALAVNAAVNWLCRKAAFDEQD